MQGIKALSSHFQSNWTQTPISWEYYNVKEEGILTNDPNLPIIAAPYVELLSIKSMTVPIEKSTKRCLYAFHIVFSIKEGVGMESFWSAIGQLQQTYENKNINQDGLILNFEEVQVGPNSVRDGRSLHQATMLFSTYECLQ